MLICMLELKTALEALNCQGENRLLYIFECELVACEQAPRWGKSVNNNRGERSEPPPQLFARSRALFSSLFPRPGSLFTG